ncbi:hypothetical protein ACO0LB_17720 [Undibacterium sp. SXout7W]|uniref:hypothetical protein n=1 Tax=Undibacterium sp. SXout7W TaxID=3413049 RepID=UPI003BF0B605
MTDALPDLIDRHGGGRSQRNLVDAFLATLHHVTSILPSIAACRQLFLRLCPDRSPSMQTFADARRRLQTKIQSMQVAAGQVNDVKASELAHLLESAVVKGIGKYLPTLENGAQVVHASQIVNFLTGELADSEQRCRNLADQVASLQGKLQAATIIKEQHQLQQQAWFDQLAQLADANRKLTDSIDGLRQHALDSIELARADTRQWKLKYETTVIAHRKRLELFEYYRRAAYARGAAIPDQLLDGETE